MAEKKVLVRHPSGHMQDIPAADVATAPQFKASVAGGTAFDANGGKVINILDGTNPQDAVSKKQLDAVSAAAVDPARNIIAGNGLTGGGNLTADRTLHVGAGVALEVLADVVNVKLGTAADTAAAGNHTHTAAAIGAVPTTRAVNTGQGLTGGGALSADRTIDLVLDGATLSKSASGLKANVGTGATQVAAGNHSHTAAAIGAVPTNRQIIAGNGLEGGGALTNDVTLTAKVGDSTVLQVDSNGIDIHPMYMPVFTGGPADDMHSHDVIFRTMSVETTGEAVTLGDPLVLDLGTGKVFKASSQLASGGIFIGFAWEFAAAADINIRVVTSGMAVGAMVGGLSPGAYWLGPTKGVLVNAPPATGRLVRVGYKTARNFLINISDFGEA